jgi:arsenite methyltransferase
MLLIFFIPLPQRINILRYTMGTEFTKAISQRYDELSGQQCCLSCGGAINYAEIKPGYYSADLGSGKGFDVLKMATMAGETGFAYGIDVSDSMMKTARENAQKLNLKNTSFIKVNLRISTYLMVH